MGEKHSTDDRSTEKPRQKAHLLGGLADGGTDGNGEAIDGRSSCALGGSVGSDVGDVASDVGGLLGVDGLALESLRGDQCKVTEGLRENQGGHQAE